MKRFHSLIALSSTMLCTLLLPNGVQAQTVFTAGSDPFSPYSYTVPAGVTNLYVQLWGAGGSAGFDPNANRSMVGGGGAYVAGILTVVPGDSFFIRPGFGGTFSLSGSALGGGFNGAYSSTIRPQVNFSSNYVTAGSGGGGGMDGVGGGGMSAFSTGGGAAGSPAASGGHDTLGGGDNTHQGGVGGANNTGGDGYTSTGNTIRVGHGGAGGQGGSSGGGGGYDTLTDTFGGGQGGSSLTLPGFTGQDAIGATPGGTTAPNYISGIGVGGFGSSANTATGGNGEIVITALSSAVPEPSTVALFLSLVGSMALGLKNRRLRRS